MNDIAQLASLAHSQISHSQSPEFAQDDGLYGAKRKAEDGQQGASKARRSRYVSLACNECKRRKIKCNGNSPCLRCGNLNLECVYAPNCCNGFKDTQEYKEMSAHVASLQEQVNVLYDNLNALRGQLGHSIQMPQAQVQQSQYQQAPSIDPALQAYSQSASYQASPETRPPSNQHTSQSVPQQSFRGATSADFNFGIAKSSLQTMGINAEGGDEHNDGAGLEDAQTDFSRGGQLYDAIHASKDPIWGVSREEAERLCQVYEDETGLMYPVVDVGKIKKYVAKLYPFMEAMHRTGLTQQESPGADSFDDEDTNILKLVFATALTAEGSGRSELGTRLFERVHPAIDNLLLGNSNTNGVRLLMMTALYEFQRDNEGTSWRLVGLAARLCIELGLHRGETYDAIQDGSERSETILLFWACYVLDRRWSLGTGMPFALQDADIDPALPRPGDKSPYLTAMIKYSEIGSRVWRALAAAPSTENGGISPINIDEMSHLDHQVLQWQRSVPPSLRFDRTRVNDESLASRAGLRSQLVIYLRANQMRILINRPVLHSASSITQYRAQADKIIGIAKDSIRVLTFINQTTDLYRRQQVVFHAFLTSALAVLFLSVAHTPAFYAENVREEFYMALDLVRGLSKGSFVSQRLWRTIKSLKEVAPKLGLLMQDGGAETTSIEQPAQQKEDMDSSRSAAVAMAGLAGHNVDEMALFDRDGAGSWLSDAGSAGNPDSMAKDLTHLFEAAGGLYGNEFGQEGAHRYSLAGAIDQAQHADTIGGVVGVDGLEGVLRELF